MTKRLFSALILSVILPQAAPAQPSQKRLINMAYVEVNSNALSNAGCYVLSQSGHPFFDVVSIFAANIGGQDVNNGELFYNPQITPLLNGTSQIKDLQSKGIKVVMTFLGNHAPAGWATVTDPAAAVRFAGILADAVQKYGLDGIDIDDEYSRGPKNPRSITMIAQALRANPKFSGKILSKALFSDQEDFEAQVDGNTLAQFLSYGAEMTYGNPDLQGRLGPYVDEGMPKTRLLIGVRANGDSTAQGLARGAKNDGYGGVMVYNVDRNSQEFLSGIARIEFGDTVSIAPGCLR